MSRATAARFGVPLNECQLSDSTAVGWISDALARMDQPSMDGFNTYIVARAAEKRGIVVALSGFGGDQCSAATTSFAACPSPMI